MSSFQIAIRNIVLNLRRSVATASVIAIGACALLFFSSFSRQGILEVETTSVRRSGHLALFPKGYFLFGSADPTHYGISDHELVKRTIVDDPKLAPLVRVVTPSVSVFGIADNPGAHSSKTYFGKGLIPEDFNQMQSWDEHQLGVRAKLFVRLSEKNLDHGVIGSGLARMLGFCDLLEGTEQSKCKPSRIEAKKETGFRDFSDVTALAGVSSSDQQEGSKSKIELLASTSGGAPNVVSLHVDAVLSQGIKEIDDSLVMMSFSLAQGLLYGRSEKKATSIILQLHRTKDMDRALALLEQMISRNGFDLEVILLPELEPLYKQISQFLSFLFVFLAAILVMVVGFSVGNTMNMNVRERTVEIGTVRALGLKRKDVIVQFMQEGLLIGLVGSTIGASLGLAGCVLINWMELTWTAPGANAAVVIKLMVSNMSDVVFAIVAGLSVIATLFSWLPSYRGSRLNIVDALRDSG